MIDVCGSSGDHGLFPRSFNSVQATVPATLMVFVLLIDILTSRGREGGRGRARACMMVLSLSSPIQIWFGCSCVS